MERVVSDECKNRRRPVAPFRFIAEREVQQAVGERQHAVVNAAVASKDVAEERHAVAGRPHHHQSTVATLRSAYIIPERLMAEGALIVLREDNESLP